jgi:hypothetical protein
MAECTISASRDSKTCSETTRSTPLELLVTTRVARMRSVAVDPVRREHDQGAWRAREEAAGSDEVADEVLREVSEAAADVPMSAETAVVRQLAEAERGR